MGTSNLQAVSACAKQHAFVCVCVMLCTSCNIPIERVRILIGLQGQPNDDEQVADEEEPAEELGPREEHQVKDHDGRK